MIYHAGDEVITVGVELCTVIFFFVRFGQLRLMGSEFRRLLRLFVFVVYFDK